ncbi:YcxB family protein [Devosia sp. 2618]|uniref:YcxB family protein n=1 Tax=Devosia sp. 2618 TaxID=3156454 RepID=UPI0033955E6E
METTGEFTLTADDVAAAGWLYTKRGLTRPRVLFSWFVLWLATLAFLTFVWGGVEQALQMPFVVLGLSLLPFVIVVGLTVLLVPIRARSNFKQQRSLQVTLTLSWSDAGLRAVSEYGTFTIPWSHFMAWTEDGKCFLLLESNRLYRLIPKRLLDTDQQNGLRTYLTQVGH